MAEDRDLGLPGSAVPAVWPDLPAVYGDVFRTFMPYIIYPGDAKVNAWWIVLFYAVLMFAEGFTCPIGYSITAVAAPKAFVTQMMTVWSMSQSVGAALNMILVNFYKEGSEVPFFIGIGAVVAILGAVVLAFSKKLAEGMGMEREA